MIEIESVAHRAYQVPDSFETGIFALKWEVTFRVKGVAFISYTAWIAEGAFRIVVGVEALAGIERMYPTPFEEFRSEPMIAMLGSRLGLNMLEAELAYHELRAMLTPVEKTMSSAAAEIADSDYIAAGSLEPGFEAALSVSAPWTKTP